MEKKKSGITFTFILKLTCPIKLKVSPKESLGYSAKT